MSNHAELVDHSIHKRHTELATAAALFSVLAHIALVVGLAFSPIDVPFLSTFVRDEPSRELPLTLMDVQSTPTAPVTREVESGTGPAGAATGPAELAEQAGRLEAPADRVDVEPPPAAAGSGYTPSPSLQSLNLPPQAETWQPRQAIMEIDRALVRDELAARARRPIPRLDRVIAAPDVVYPANPNAAAGESIADAAKGLAEPTLATILRRVTGATSGRPEPVSIPDPIARSGTGVLAETPAEVSQFEAIEALLSASVVTFADRRDPDYGYFRVEVNRRSAETLPVLPKDILFVQDCSASLSEQRLYFCRQGLTAALAKLGPEDRFNVVAFREALTPCFDGWMTNTPAARVRAEQFIAGLKSEGETDVFAGIQAALNVPVEAGRPAIVLLISDGHSTTGMKDGASIIREFTKGNRGAVSVFTMGVTPQGYLYLLDLLSYSNRGDSRVVTRGRWEIPEVIQALSEEVRHPVLSAVGVQVAASTRCEIYPVQTMNLYRDRPLVLYGRYPTGQKRVLLQATGQAPAKRCDMIFDLSLEDAPRAAEEDNLRTTWARQKLYHLLGEHARTRDPALVSEIDATSRAYRVPVPHRDSM